MTDASAPPILDPPRLAALAGLGAVTFSLCWLAAQYFNGAAGIAAVWPANALALAFILRMCPTPRHGRVALGVTFAAMIAANLAIGRPIDLALAFSFANVVEIAVAAWFMRRIAMPLCGLSDLGQFLLGAVVAGPLASTLIAALVMNTRLGVAGPELVTQAGGWMLADMMGMAIVAPFALSLGSVSRNGWLRALAVPVMIGAACFFLAWQEQMPVVFVSFPLVALAVLNDRDRGGALGVGAVAIAIVGAALLGEGPIARLPQYGVDPMVAVPAFLGSLVLTVAPLSAVLKRLDVLAAELDRRRAVAEHDSAAKSELIGRVGEELRSPLTGVVTVAEMLRSGRLGDLNDRQRDLLARVAESGAEIESLSREMMALADGGAQLAERSAAVDAVVQEAASATRFRARRAKVSLKVLSGPAEWRAGIDPDRLRRLLVDAIGSALEAAPTGSSVRVVAGLDGETAFRIVVEDEGSAGLAERQARFAAASLETPAVEGVAIDRVELRRIGGDLSFGPGALGGGRISILLPRAVDAGRRDAA